MMRKMLLVLAVFVGGMMVAGCPKDSSPEPFSVWWVEEFRPFLVEAVDWANSTGIAMFAERGLRPYQGTEETQWTTTTFTVTPQFHSEWHELISEAYREAGRDPLAPMARLEVILRPAPADRQALADEAGVDVSEIGDALMIIRNRVTSFRDVQLSWRPFFRQ